jgi:hypothetical protein
MKRFHVFVGGKSRATHRLWHVFGRYSGGRTGEYFRRWAARLDWRGVANSRASLAQRYSDQNLKSRMFAEWRLAFTNLIRIRARRDLCLRTLWKLMSRSNEGMARARFTLWYNRVFFFNTQ